MKKTNKLSKMNTPAQRLVQRWSEGSNGKQVSKVRAACRKQGWGGLLFGQSIEGLPFSLGGKTFTEGLGTHADSEVVLTSVQPMLRFRALVGVDDNKATRACPGTRIIFSLEAQGRQLWQSPELGVESAPVPVDVTLPANTCELVLRVKAPNGVINYAHADWADATVMVGKDKVRFEGGHLTSQVVPEPAPFSFVYGGKLSSELLPKWKRTTTTRKGPHGETLQEVTWHDPETSLDCVMECSYFSDFSAVEWVLNFRNGGKANSPILENVQALDLNWAVTGDTSLFRSRGSPCTMSDFEYLREPLPAGATIKMAAGGGRSSNDWLPFFNLQSGSEGLITAIGWTGQWAAEYAHLAAGGGVQVRAGMELTHLTLHPGESIRSPRIALLFWTGDRMAGHNQLRQFLLNYHSPEPNGKRLQAPLTMGHWGGMKSNEHLERIKTYRRAKLDYDYYWIDAGWYGPADSYSPDEFTGDWWKHVGNWTVNPAAHPNGLRPLSDAAAGANMKFLLWFEPERAIEGTPWTVEHPGWFLGEHKPLGHLLLDLGNPEALKWLTDYMVDFVERNNVMLYRQDFNFDPLPYWRGNDAPDRQGMTEIRHVEGLYKFWDALLTRRPGLVIDNCSSGGRRIDLETISRSIPLWRSDWQCSPLNDPIGGQVHGMGLSYWIPLHGTGVWSSMPASAGDTYRVRSNMGPGLMFAAFPYERNPIDPKYPWNWHRQMIREVRRTQPLFTGDYYPLTGCTPAVDHWAAYQMDRADLKEGFVMAFRRRESIYTSATFPLSGIDPKAQYELEDADNGRTRRVRGKALIENGIPIELDQPHLSKLIFYRKVGR